MFIWDFVADKILGQIVDWFYGQVVGFLGNFFAEMGNMGVELFEMSWVQSIVLFFSYLAWALYGTGLVVACFECGIEYSSGRGNIRETALNAIKGFMAVSLFTVVPVRLYELSVTLQGQLTAGITGYANREDLEHNLPKSNKAEDVDVSGAYAVSGRGGMAHEPAVDKPRRRGGKQMKTYGEEDL